LVGKS